MENLDLQPSQEPESDVSFRRRTISGQKRLDDAIEGLPAGKPLSIRCDLRLLDGGQYRWWPDASWMVDIQPDREKANQLKEVIGLLFERLTDEGMQKVRERLLAA